MAGVAGAAVEAGAAAERTSAEAGVEEVAEERPSAVEAAVALVAAAWEAWAIAVHSHAVETSDSGVGTLAIEATTSHKVAGSTTVAGSTDDTTTEIDSSSVFRFMTTAITTMIMDTTAAAVGCIVEQSIRAARTGGAATNSA